MKETLAQFGQRSGCSYIPAPSALALGKALPVDFACPTLYRFPGALGLHDFFSGRLAALAPGSNDVVWLAATARATKPRAPRRFGALAVLEPWRLSPCRGPQRGWYLGANLDLRHAGAIVWLTPQAVRSPPNFDAVADAQAAVRLMQPGYGEALARATAAVAAYLEEISSLHKAGVPPQSGDWFQVPAATRRALLTKAGLRPLWTGKR